MRAKIFQIVFWLVLGAVLVLAWLPAKEVAVFGFSYDKLNHIAAFFALGVLGRVSWPHSKSIWVIFGLLLVGVGIEVVQHFLGRDASVWDVLADTIGLALAVVATFWRR